MRLRLPDVERQPVLPRLAEPVVHRLAPLLGNGMVPEEEAPAVEIERHGGAEVIGVLVPPLEDVAIRLVGPRIEPVQRLERRPHVQRDAEVPEPPEAGRDVERDVVVGTAAREPGPRAVGKLELLEPPREPLGLAVQPVLVEQDPDVAASLALGLRLSQPGSLLEHHGLQVLVLLEWRVERRRGAPLLEHAADPGVGGGDVARQRGGIEAVEGLFGALVRELHQVRQRHHRIPGGMRDHLHGKRLVAQRGGLAGALETREIELPRPGAADRQRQGFGDEDAAREHGDEPFLAVGDASRGGDGLVREEAEAIGDLEPPRVGARLRRRHSQRLLGPVVAERLVDALTGERVPEGEAHAAALRRVRAVDDLDCEIQRVALAQEARRIGLNHDLASGVGAILEQPGSQLAVVGEGEEPPLGERLGHGELELHLAVPAGDEMREEEGGLAEVGARGDAAEVGARGRAIGRRGQSKC